MPARNDENSTVEFESSEEPEFHGALPPPEPVLLPPGYEFLGVLGKGGMGVVYKAWQKSLSRTVAIKMILNEKSSSDGTRRFRTEAESIARLQHPNIVQIFEFGEFEGKYYFAMEYCARGSISRAKLGSSQSFFAAAEVVSKIARAVESAHSKQIIHRDLKPGNVLLAEIGEPKVSDFGLAKKMDEADQTLSGTILGTPAYMAPEQALGNLIEIGPSVDIYAAGAMLYDLITGRPPFQAASVKETLRRVVTDEPEKPSRFRKDIPADLDTICMKCLEKEISKRYARAADLADDLDRFLRGDAILAKQARWWHHTIGFARREPWVALGIVLCLPLLLCFAVIAPVPSSFVVAWFAVTYFLVKSDLRISVAILLSLAGVTLWTSLAPTDSYLTGHDAFGFEVLAWISAFFAALCRTVAWQRGGSILKIFACSLGGTFAAFALAMLSSTPVILAIREYRWNSNFFMQWIWPCWIGVCLLCGPIIGALYGSGIRPFPVKPRRKTLDSTPFRLSSANVMTMRGRFRAASLVILTGIAACFISVGSQISFGPLPAWLVGCIMIAFAMCGLFGVNIWYGGPLDPSKDPPE